MKNMTISKKLILGFGAVLALMVLSAALSLYGIGAIGNQLTLYTEYTMPNSVSVWTMRRGMVAVERDILEASISEDIKSISEALDRTKADEQSLRETLDAYAGSQRDDAQSEQIRELQSLLDQSVEIRKKISPLLGTPSMLNRQKAGDLYFDQYLPLMDQMTDIFMDFSDSAAQQAAQQAAQAQSTATLAWIMLGASAAVSLVVTILIVKSIRKSIMAPVSEIATAYREMAGGSLNAKISYEGRDELGQMAALIQETNQMQSALVGDVIEKLTKISQGDLRLQVDLDYPGDYALLKQTIENTISALNDTMKNINTAAEQVSTGSDQVSSGAQALAAGSTEQAASVEELAAAVEKIAGQAEENSAAVLAASKSVQQAGTGASAGNEHMQQLIRAMADIYSSSNKIASITKVIEDIAFQTNILALNAAIEAARAGSAGKGFAVVADEVRNLAAKSAEAAKQTGELIQSSVDTVEKGAMLTDQTALILQEVGTSAEEVVGSFGTIKQSIAAQTVAIEQIRDGLAQISSVVQTNAATAEENSATSEEMSAQAATLRREVGRFKLADSTAGESSSLYAYSAQEPEVEFAFQADDSFGKY